METSTVYGSIYSHPSLVDASGSEFFILCTILFMATLLTLYGSCKIHTLVEHCCYWHSNCKMHSTEKK